VHTGYPNALDLRLGAGGVDLNQQHCASLQDKPIAKFS
jgi:hypothetical protein